MTIEPINPETMSAPRGYSHAISVTGNHKTVYIGGQNAINQAGELVGKGNLQEQTLQVLSNIEKILQKAGGKLENTIKFNIYLVQGQNPAAGFVAFQQKWKGQTPPVVTVLFVAGLGNPDWLLEIDATAIIPE
ncbi:MAG: RidA family protein [Candidatus Bathyarchaeia archaeon]|jgi:enamine deaminase RidA (YjgF/YER057c/UK114 family)